jgi:hypothetical protein
MHSSRMRCRGRAAEVGAWCGGLLAAASAGPNAYPEPRRSRLQAVKHLERAQRRQQRPALCPRPCQQHVAGPQVACGQAQGVELLEALGDIVGVPEASFG